MVRKVAQTQAPRTAAIVVRRRPSTKNTIAQSTARPKQAPPQTGLGGTRGVHPEPRVRLVPLWLLALCDSIADACVNISRTFCCSGLGPMWTRQRELSGDRWTWRIYQHEVRKTRRYGLKATQVSIWRCVEGRICRGDDVEPAHQPREALSTPPSLACVVALLTLRHILLAG